MAQDSTGIAPPDPDSVAAFAALAEMLRAVIDGATAEQSSVLATRAAGGGLSPEEIISDAAVVMFGGIDTTDGMIANAVLHLLARPVSWTGFARIRRCCPRWWRNRCGWNRPPPSLTATPPLTSRSAGRRSRPGTG